MPTARRFDAATLAPGGVTRDARGYLTVPAFVTRVGVLAYKRADGTVVRELRHPDHVFRADSLATLNDAPVTVGHPGSGTTWVSADNAHELEVGLVRDAGPEGTFVSSRLTVRRADAIKRIDSKELVEVSAGYDADIVCTPGVYEGQAYDQVQTNIRYNHVALLPPGGGRAGRDVRLRADSADAVIDEDGASDTTANEPPRSAPPEDAGTPALQGDSMSARKIRVDGVEYELPETPAGVLEKVVQQRDELSKNLSAEKKRADAAEAERDVMKGELTAARDPQNIHQLVAQRVELERSASKVLGQEQRFDGLTDRQVREKVLAVVSTAFKTEGRSDDAVTAAFEYALSSQANVNQGLKLVGRAIEQTEQPRADSNAIDFAKEFAALEEKRLSAWKPRTGGN